MTHDDLIHELMWDGSWVPVAHHEQMIKSLRVYVISSHVIDHKIRNVNSHFTY